MSHCYRRYLPLLFIISLTACSLPGIVVEPAPPTPPFETPATTTSPTSANVEGAGSPTASSADQPNAQSASTSAETLDLFVETDIITSSYLRINAVGPGGRAGEAGIILSTVADQRGELRDPRGEQINSSLSYRNPDGSGDSTAPLADGATIIELRPETYTVAWFGNRHLLLNLLELIHHMKHRKGR